MGCLLILWLKKKKKKVQSFQLRALYLMVTSVEMQINLFFPQRRWKNEIEAKSLEKLTETNMQTKKGT